MRNAYGICIALCSCNAAFCQQKSTRFFFSAKAFETNSTCVVIDIFENVSDAPCWTHALHVYMDHWRLMENMSGRSGFTYVALLSLSLYIYINKNDWKCSSAVYVRTAASPSHTVCGCNSCLLYNRPYAGVLQAFRGVYRLRHSSGAVWSMFVRLCVVIVSISVIPCHAICIYASIHTHYTCVTMWWAIYIYIYI